MLGVYGTPLLSISQHGIIYIYIHIHINAKKLINRFSHPLRKQNKTEQKSVVNLSFWVAKLSIIKDIYISTRRHICIYVLSKMNCREWSARLVGVLRKVLVECMKYPTRSGKD